MNLAMTQDVNNEFVRLIKILKKNRFTYKEIAESIGIDHQKINNIKRGISSADEELIKKLYEAYPELHDINHENPDPPPPMIDVLEEMRDRLSVVEKESNQMRIDLNQVRYILDKLIEDLRLLGEVQRIMYEGMKDPELRDVFAQWPEILAKFQSSIALPDEDLPGSDLPED
jgi:transcriptional regulator with XRE-family HTH domain